MLILLLTYVETNMVKKELSQNNTINNIQIFYNIIETKLKKEWYLMRQNNTIHKCLINISFWSSSFIVLTLSPLYNL